jgi:hypothetical protein
MTIEAVSTIVMIAVMTVVTVIAAMPLSIATADQSQFGISQFHNHVSILLLLVQLPLHIVVVHCCFLSCFATMQFNPEKFKA